MPSNYATCCDDFCTAFADSYELSNLPAMRDVERDVLGCDYGGTSWTTLDQARDIIDALELRRGVHLLEIGAGSGWPGLLLADSSGCDVSLVDLPLNALAMAARRAVDDGIANRVSTIAASGTALPFGPGNFAAISHSDVLCCLPEKSAMLQECRRVAAVGGRMLFSVIALANGLSAAARRAAVDVGPPFIDAPADYDQLLADCGWQRIERTDCTGAYRTSLDALARAFASNGALTDAMGADVAAEAHARRREQIAAIDDGLLVREIFLATTAGPG